MYVWIWWSWGDENVRKLMLHAMLSGCYSDDSSKNVEVLWWRLIQSSVLSKFWFDVELEVCAVLINWIKVEICLDQGTWVSNPIKWMNGWYNMGLLSYQLNGAIVKPTCTLVFLWWLPFYPSFALNDKFYSQWILTIWMIYFCSHQPIGMLKCIFQWNYDMGEHSYEILTCIFTKNASLCELLREHCLTTNYLIVPTLHG